MDVFSTSKGSAIRNHTSGRQLGMPETSHFLQIPKRPIASVLRQLVRFLSLLPHVFILPSAGDRSCGSSEVNCLRPPDTCSSPEPQQMRAKAAFRSSRIKEQQVCNGEGKEQCVGSRSRHQSAHRRRIVRYLPGGDHLEKWNRRKEKGGDRKFRFLICLRNYARWVGIPNCPPW